MEKKVVINNVINYTFYGIYSGKSNIHAVCDYVLAMEFIHGVKYSKHLIDFVEGIDDYNSKSSRYFREYLVADYKVLSITRNNEDADSFIELLVNELKCIVCILKEER